MISSFNCSILSQSTIGLLMQDVILNDLILLVLLRVLSIQLAQFDFFLVKHPKPFTV